MTITDNRTRNLIRFNQLDIGDCFEVEGRIYMRVYPAYEENGGGHFNAVSLNSGETDYFDGGATVAPLNTHLVIDDPVIYESGSYRNNY